MSSTGPSPSNTNSTQNTPSTSTRSRLLLSNRTPPSSSTTIPSASSSTSNTPNINNKGGGGGGTSGKFPVVDEKLFSRHSNTLVANSNRRKTELADHMKRIAELRKETDYLDRTDWMYEPVEKLLGK